MRVSSIMCDRNCDAVIEGGRIWTESIREIAVGEELAYDYAYILKERHTPTAKRRYSYDSRSRATGSYGILGTGTSPP